MGYVRETIFLVINSVLYQYDFPYNRSYVTPPNFIYDCSIDYLVGLKWALTVLFSLAFMGMLLWLIKIYFTQKRLYAYTLLIYGIFFSVSLIFISMGYVIGEVNSIYPIARFFMGLAQSPLTILILFVVFYFYEKYEVDKTLSN